MLLEICLPVKDEEKILATNLQKIIDYCESANFTFDWKIIGLSNGSTDRTVEILNVLKQNNPKRIDYIELLLPGKGRALKKYWQMSGADILVSLDIDLSVSPEQLPALINPLINNEADIVIGSRFLVGSRIKRSKFRGQISKIFNWLSRFMFAHKISDLQCGFKAVKSDVYQKISPYLRNNYFYFDSELLVIGLRFSYRLKEVPVDWAENRFQVRVSKIKIVSDSFSFLCDMLFFRLRLFFIPKN